MTSIRSLLLLVAISIDRALAQTCAPGTTVGVCLYLVPGDLSTGICPTGSTCLINLPRPMCCQDENILLPTLPTDPPPTTTTPVPTTTTAPPAADDSCFDLLNPLTGESDCAAKRGLCADGNYYDVMAVQCPVTCGFCASTTPTICADQVNPATCSVTSTDCNGVRTTTLKTCESDCTSMAKYCDMPAYRSLMTAQCPQTCKRCGVPALSQPTGCADLLNPVTGYSDCKHKSALCRESRYSQVMVTQCPRTCGLCTTASTQAFDLALKHREFRSKLYPSFARLSNHIFS